MNWAERRKLFYAFIVCALLAGGVWGIYHRATSGPISCTNGRQDGGETGVDCGGPCQNYCPYELSQPSVRWVRAFAITPGIVHAVAYIEYNHPGAASDGAPYTFTLYDEKNTVIATRSGRAYLGPSGRTAIVETLIPTGNATVAVARFAFDGAVPWKKIPDAFAQVVIKTDKTTLESGEHSTTVSSTLQNQSRYAFNSLDVIAVLYDDSGNAITASKSVIPSLPATSGVTVFFTWPFSMPTKVSRIEIIPRINPFTARTS